MRKAKAPWKKTKQGLAEEDGVPVVSQERVMAIISGKRKKRTLGKDGISYQALGCLHEKAAGRFWKTATIVLIPKGDKGTDQLAN